MPASPLLPIVLAVLACVVCGAVAVPAETLPGQPTTPPVRDETAMRPIEFYLAHGEADACGAGCHEWIAAEGKIDAKAAQNLHQLLAKLKGRQLPIFFHSPGGSVDGSIALGRLIHQQRLTVSVGRTVPLGCDRDKPLEESCVALKRSGQEVEAKIDSAFAMCNSACVYALAAGAVRLVPPWVRIGIHDVAPDPDRKVLRRDLEAAAKRLAYGRLRYYLREVGADESLFTAAIAVPSNSLKFLQRDEIVRFGIDRREFGETAWQFADKPPPSIRKRFFVRTEQTRYVDALVNMDCGFGLSMHVVLARQSLPAESASPPAPTSVSIDGKPFHLVRGDNPDFYVSWTLVPRNTFDAVADKSTIVVPGAELGRKDAVTLSMDGFSAAYGKLRKVCPAAPIAQAPTPAKNPVTGSQILAAIQNPQAAQSTTVVQDTPAPPPTAPVPESQTREFTKVVAAGQKLRVEFLYAIQPDCSSAGQIVVRVLERPQHGTLAVEEGQGFTVFPKEHPSSACNTVKSDGRLVFYQPNHDYLGTDSVTLYVIYPFGKAATLHYTIQVK